MLTLAILAGGSSSRMGRDKALLHLQGRPLVEYVLERLSPMADEVILSTNTPAAFSFLNIATLPDETPGLGPLGGLRTVLEAAQYPFVAAAACDMPFASRALFEYELDLLQKTGSDAVLPSTDAGLEPLHAVYRRETCLPVIGSALQNGLYRLTDWLEVVKTQIVLPEVIARYDPDGWAFWNLNRPEDLLQAEAELERRKSRR